MTESTSVTHRYSTPEGKIYITITREPETWVHVSCGKAGTQAQVFADRLAAVIGMALRGGVSADKLANALVGSTTERSGNQRGVNGHTAFSIPDAVGLAIREGV